MSAIEQSSLILLYENKQQWAMHYETLVATITPVSTTVVLAAIAVSQDAASADKANWLTLLSLVLLVFTIWFTRWCDRELTATFKYIVQIEIGLGMYDLSVGGSPVLPKKYKETPYERRPIITAGYATQFVSSLALLTDWKIVSVIIGFVK